MRPTKQNWIEGMMWVGIVAATIMSILVFASLGCASPAKALGEGAGQGAVRELLTQLDTKINHISQQQMPPVQPMSEGGMAAVMAAINGAFGVFYLVRKKWFNIEGTNVLVKKKTVNGG
jgi:hypothetical protein